MGRMETGDVFDIAQYTWDATDAKPGAVTCLLCDRQPGRGNWQVCPACRARLTERHRRAVARMKPPVCLGCGRAIRPAPGRVYCLRCKRRFEAPPVAEESV